VEQRNPDGVPSYMRHQFALDCFFRPPVEPSSEYALQAVGAHHRDHPLFLVGVQHFGHNGPLLPVERTIEAKLLIAMAEAPDGCMACAVSGTRPSATTPTPADHPDTPHNLRTPLQQRLQLLLILFTCIELQGWTTHTPSVPQEHLYMKMLFEDFTRRSET
jgi:hypothetical protein